MKDRWAPLEDALISWEGLPMLGSMQFEKVTTVSHPAALVLETMMHKLEELTPYRSRLHDLKTEIKEELDNGDIRTLRCCQAVVQSVPTIFRAFVDEGMLVWQDDSIWTPRQYRATWTINNGLGHLYKCHGVNYFEPDPSHPNKSTRIRITGEISIDPEKIPGVPAFVARRLVPRAERIIINLIEPDLAEVAVALQKYLDQRVS
jgi:hypothetical protein